VRSRAGFPACRAPPHLDGTVFRGMTMENTPLWLLLPLSPQVAKAYDIGGPTNIPPDAVDEAA
jgi:hypothetical protein